MLGFLRNREKLVTRRAFSSAPLPPGPQGLVLAQLRTFWQKLPGPSALTTPRLPEK